MTLKFTSAAAEGKLVVDPHIADHVVDPSITLTLRRVHSSDTEFAPLQDSYRLSVSAPCGHAIEMNEYLSLQAVGSALRKLVPGEQAAAMLELATNRFRAAPGKSAAIDLADDGIAFWAGFRRPERRASLARCVGEITGFDGRMDQGFPLMTLPIERFALDASVVRSMTQIYQDDLACVHHNAMTLRDRAAASAWFATQEGKEAHDQFELGRRAAAGALVAKKVMHPDKAAATLRPLQSDRGWALDGTLHHRTVMESLLAVVGLGY